MRALSSHTPTHLLLFLRLLLFLLLSSIMQERSTVSIANIIRIGFIVNNPTVGDLISR